MTIKWNWGTKIMLVYVGFVLFMLSFVYFSSQQKFDLVTPDYYAQELKYQQVIDGQNNTNALEKPMQIEEVNNSIVIALPIGASDIKGTIQFYRPNNADLDFNLVLNGSGTIAVPKDRLKSGIYKVKATWTTGGKAYFDEQAWVAQ